MARITADQINALYGEFDEKGRKKLNLPFSEKRKIVKEGMADMYRKITKLDVQDMTDDELMNIFLKYSEVSDTFANELAKQDIRDLFSDKDQVAELRRMLKENKGDIEYILNGYKKLGKVKKIEKEIEELEKQINEIKLRLYCEKKSLQTANRAVIARVQRLNDKIEQKKIEKEKLLQTKEIVAAYESQKIAGYADRLRKGKLVYTPSVEKNRESVRNSVFTGQNILLTGPVGTGKTRLAIDIFKDILEEKRKRGEIDDTVYQKLSQLCVVNGNEDTSIREIKSRPIQMSNKEGEENVFKYDEGLLTLCLKYGMPLIIDEANRTSPNFLSSLKKFWALKPGQEYKDEITGEIFKIKAPLQVILTSNEGQKYGKHTTEFQDQIERELERVHVGYMPEDELYDLAKAKLYETPGIAYVTERDLRETLPNLINAVTETNELYTSGKEFSSTESTSDMRLSSTVIDTKRFLELIDREIIGTGETFWDELNQKIVKFIQGIKPSDAGDMDRKILCIIFHKNRLLCKENIPELIKGADKLTAHDLSTIISSTKSQLGISRGERLVNPWQFAKGYGKLINREGDKENHRLANFENLDFEDNGTNLKIIGRSLRGLGVLNPMDDRDLINKLKNLDESNLEEVLEGVAWKVMLKNDEKCSKDLIKILESADEIFPGIKNRVYKNMGLTGLEETDSDELIEGDGEIVEKLKEYRKVWKEKIDFIEDEFKEKIIKAAKNIPVKVNIESDGSRLIEFKLGGKKYKILDVNVKTHTDDEYYTEFIDATGKKVGGTIPRGMMGDDVNEWENKRLSEYVKQKEKEGFHKPKREEMEDLCNKLGDILTLMYLTGMNGIYCLNMDSSDDNFFNCLLYEINGSVGFFQFGYKDVLAGSICLIASED